MNGERPIAKFFAPVLALMREFWDEPAILSDPTFVLGAVRYAGSSRPLPSSAAKLTVGKATVWIPCPLDPGDAAAAIFQHAGRKFVLPLVRLCVHAPEEQAGKAVIEYVTPGEWLSDAVGRWRFPREYAATEEGGTSAQPATLREMLTQYPIEAETSLPLLARMIRYAIFGTNISIRMAITEKTELVLPKRPQWLRPIVETPLGYAAASSLVITARLHKAPYEDFWSSQNPIQEWNSWKNQKRKNKRRSNAENLLKIYCEKKKLSSSDFQAWLAAEWIPKSGLRAGDYRIIPTRECDLGLDPVHTPEGANIRLTGHLGCGVEIRNRGLVKPAGVEVQLSVSTAQIPFAGHNDPRRLLMGANMQVHALPVNGGEVPLVRTTVDAAVCRPPGANLRVGYLAWQGLNHEDAWVISEAAARRLVTTQEKTLVVAIRSFELYPKVLVQPGDQVRRGQQLLNRRASPVLLSSSIDVLACLPRFDVDALLTPTPEELAPFDGTVIAVESWDLVQGSGLPDGWHIPEDLVSRYRQILRIRIERELPLRLGDKLANRHGHKGIVGAILAEDDMPRWNGQPLEALIDPVSVLNRSNWGQVYETLAGAAPGSASRHPVGAHASATDWRPVGSDASGRSQVLPPSSGGWLAGPIWAVAGAQFVMRLPHLASERIAASPSPEPARVKERAQRFGEMDHWALWAHNTHQNTATRADGRALTAAAERLGRVLGMAGYDLQLDSDVIVIKQLRLDEKPPDGAQRILLGEMTRPESYKAIDGVESGRPTVLVFEPPVEAVPLPGAQGRRKQQTISYWSIRWLPIAPLKPDRVMPSDRADEPHPLTVALRDVARAAYYRKHGHSSRRREWTAEQLEARLRYAVRDVMQTAYAHAVGERASGEESSKFSVLRRSVLGRRLRHSVRATVAPAGPLGLGLDEVGLPAALARALLAVGNRRIADTNLDEMLKSRWFWIKRDPVLHRWGLLPVRARLIEGDVIRLPASLLGPMGADFDGDTVALFAALPGLPSECGRYRPSTLAAHDVLKQEGGQRRAMFLPGKQYQYGLGRLMARVARLENFQEALRQSGAPALNGSLSPGEALTDWVRRASGPDADGRWWCVVEEHVLAALAEEPGMEFGILSADNLSELAVVRWGAAKGDLFDKDQPDAWQALLRILGGESLAPYTTIPGANLPDPIADVMVAAKAAVGRFGAALRRLLYSTPDLGTRTIADAQTLTEQVTQRALSVKAGKQPIPFVEFEKQLRRLLVGKPTVPSANEELRALLAKVSDMCERLRVAMTGERILWLDWLRSPQELAACIAEAEGKELRLPLDDPRVRVFLSKD